MSVINTSRLVFVNIYDGYYRQPRGTGWYKTDDSNHNVFEPKYCEGCGRLAMIGRVNRFCSVSCSKSNGRSSFAAKPGMQWKGDEAGYTAMHNRLPKATSCVFGCEHTRYENAHMLDELGPPDEYISFCARCHQRYDAAIRMMQKDHVERGWRPKGAVA